jgi:hypothetical protein
MKTNSGALREKHALYSDTLYCHYMRMEFFLRLAEKYAEISERNL